jgi:molecular chaperone DnaK (HSP70)
MSDLESLVCPKCGGKLSPSRNTVALICQYCGTEHYPQGESIDEIIPRLHGTISVGILGGAAIPLLAQGTPLPAEIIRSFSTVIDNQPKIEVELVFGENHLTIDNISIGRFILENITPAQQGVPKIDIKVSVDENKQLTVTATEVFAKRTEVIGKVDMSKFTLPPSRGNSTLSHNYKDALKTYKNVKQPGGKKWWQFWKK